MDISSCEHGRDTKYLTYYCMACIVGNGVCCVNRAGMAAYNGVLVMELWMRYWRPGTRMVMIDIDIYDKIPDTIRKKYIQ